MVTENTGHKAGFVALVGKPNAGKSSLLNHLVGESLAIVTPRAQTTRHRIKGILNGDAYQIVFSDTPGILKPVYKLHEKMLEVVQESISDADVIVYVTDASEKPGETEIPGTMLNSGAALVVAINKIDLADQPQLDFLADAFTKKYPGIPFVPVSATESFHVDVLLKVIVDRLPQSPPYFSKDEFTDRSQRFFVSEIIREKILMLYKEEIPYCAEVAVETFREQEGLVEIFTVIYVMRDSQKGIILGHEGKAIKRMATKARLHIEKWLGKKVYLDVTVKVNPGWRDDEGKLKKLGY